ncbi:MAG: hypothetical protein JWM27_3181 [Gemmatimonadetes bacterium]|nr:hypothetical protein [Gemmatimonadota bacterium]
MSLRKELYETMVREREHETVEADRARRWAAVVTLLVCLLWCALGGAVLAWGLMTYDEKAGRTALQAGPEIAAAGTILTLLYSYRKSEKRGDR